MTSTNRDIVRRALRKLGALASGSNPSDAEATDALEILQSQYLNLAQIGALGRIYDVIATADGDAMENTRVRADEGVTVTLPLTYGSQTSLPSQYPLDWELTGYCCYGDWGARAPRNQAVVADALGNYWMYKADLGKWVNLSGVTLNSEFPFSEGLANGFAAWLAISLADEYGAQIGAGVQLDARNLSVAITHNYDSAARPSYEPY